METIKVLIIGKHEWVDRISEMLGDSFSLEKIEDEDAAISRLTHNSYNVLLLQDTFSKYDATKLASLAYAMTRPSIIVCSSMFKYIKFKIWHHFSKFSKKFKTSRKLINFNHRIEDLKKQVHHASHTYSDYFNKVNEEIKKNTL